MASSIAGSAIFTPARPLHLRRIQAVHGSSGLKSVLSFGPRKSFQSLQLQSSPLRLRISCAAKPETVTKVCEIVRKQLALPDDSTVTGESTFSALGADSLDTVEIVMGLEEAFGITLEEDNAQSIATVQDAADMIEELSAAN